MATAERNLDRTSILAAALSLVDREGLSRLNMRALAHELGVGTMSLYHHFPSKDALLDGIVEALMAEIEIPEAGETSNLRASRVARSLRAVALRHPNCVPLMVTRPFATAGGLRPCEAAFEALAEAGLSTDEALVAFRTIVAFVLGFVMLEPAGFFGGVGHDCDPDDLRRLNRPRLDDSPQLVGRDIGAGFEACLRIIERGALRGLARR